MRVGSRVGLAKGELDGGAGEAEGCGKRLARGDFDDVAGLVVDGLGGKGFEGGEKAEGGQMLLGEGDGEGFDGGAIDGIGIGGEAGNFGGADDAEMFGGSVDPELLAVAGELIAAFIDGGVEENAIGGLESEVDDGVFGFFGEAFGAGEF